MINHALVSHYSRTNATVSKVIKKVQEGWSVHGDLPGEYYNRRNELSVELNCLLWGARVVIPHKLREGVLNLLHATHLGIVNMKALARSYFWWPGTTTDIEDLARNCEVCKLNQKNPPKTVLHPWIPSKEPWERIHIDFCTFDLNQWLVVVDSFSKWAEIVDMKKCTSSEATIKELRKLFATWGLPRIVVSDNGPQLVSEEIKQFFRSNGIEHIPIPSYKPQCNGLAERMVGSFKTAMKKMKQKNTNVAKNLACWLLTYRNTPHGTSKRTPAEVMLGRRTRTKFSLLYPELIRPSPSLSTQHQVMRQFKVSDKVYYKDALHGVWKPGKVVEHQGDKVYRVLDHNGVTHTKHIDQLISGLPDPQPDYVKIDDRNREIDKSLQFTQQNFTPDIENHINPDFQPKFNMGSTKPSCTEKVLKPFEHAKVAPSVTPVPCDPTTPVRASNRSRKAPERLTYNQLGGTNINK